MASSAISNSSRSPDASAAGSIFSWVRPSTVPRQRLADLRAEYPARGQERRRLHVGRDQSEALDLVAHRVDELLLTGGEREHLGIETVIGAEEAGAPGSLPLRQRGPQRNAEIEIGDSRVANRRVGARGAFAAHRAVRQHHIAELRRRHHHRGADPHKPADAQIEQLMEHDRGDRAAHAESRRRHPATRPQARHRAKATVFFDERSVFRDVRRSGRCERGRRPGSPPRRPPPDGIRCTRRFETFPNLTPLSLRDAANKARAASIPAFAASRGLGAVQDRGRKEAAQERVAGAGRVIRRERRRPERHPPGRLESARRLRGRASR